MRSGSRTVSARVLDVRQDRLGDLEEVLLDADVRRRQRLAVLQLVRARRPHEVAAVRVDVDRELDLREGVRDPQLVLHLGLGAFERAGERVAGAAGRRRAVVAVEDGADGGVAVEVDAPVVAVADVAAGRAGRAVVGHVAALGAEVVERVVAAVRVRRRQDEDVEVVDVGLGRRVRRVVLDEPLGGLQARDRGDPLTGVLLAVDVDAGLGARAVLADAQDALVERPALDVRRSGQVVRQRHARTGRDDAGAGVAGHQVGGDERARGRRGR